MLHSDMLVYKESMKLVKIVYEICELLPKSEMMGLIFQIKKSVISIPSNISEGAGRKSPSELSQFLNIALGSTTELNTQLEIAEMLGFVKDCAKLKQVFDQLTMVKKLLIGLKRSLNKP